MALSFSDAKQFSITGYLSKLGYEPAKVRGCDYWYHSPLRSERTPSFKVNDKLNVWYDHGTGEGGTLIDLGIRLHGCAPRDFLHILEGEVLPVVPKHDSPPASEPKLTVLAMGDLKDEGLLDYLQRRQIPADIACQYCCEVNFAINHRHYLAIGFQNTSGGYELRNHWFKGSSSPKDITLIKNNTPNLCVMEGFMDFLSLSQLQGQRHVPDMRSADFLVLNSLSLLRKNLDVIRPYKKITLFLDNDKASDVAKEVLRDASMKFTDASTLYYGFKDVNEFIRPRDKVEDHLVRYRRLYH